MRLPDLLCWFRLVMGSLRLLFALLQWRTAFAWGLLLALASDALDGALARRLGVASSRGARLDSLADAVLFGVVLVGIYAFEPELYLQAAWVWAGTLALDLLELVLAYARYGRLASFHTWRSKLAAVVGGAFVLWLFFHGLQWWLFYLAAGLYALACVEDIALILLLREWRADVRGLPALLRERGAKARIDPPSGG